MNVSLNWLKELVDINCEYPELVNKFNLKSAEISRLEKLVEATNLTTGHVLTCVPHPQSDHLHICEVDVAQETLQIICGAPNVEAGQKVVVAKVGAVLPGDFSIKKAKIRGVESNGMICSLDELGIEHKYHGEDGIHVLKEDSVPGSDPLKNLQLDDTVMEIDITPNRSDLLSMRGVAYDTAAILGTKVHIKKPEVEEISEENPCNVFTETNGCKSYYARVVRNVQIHESPIWLKSRLIAAGIRPINNVVDISNYVMLETGQPLHTFDFDKIPSKKIVVRDALPKETIVTLDGKTRTLVPEDLVISDGERAIALAGVMGGTETEVDESTRTILIESATFDPIRIRKTSKRLDLRSEASIRFERGLDPFHSIVACDRTAELLRELAQGEILKGVSFFDTHDASPRVVRISLHKIAQTTGRTYTQEEIKDVFDRLGFDSTVRDGEFSVQLPSRRQDLNTYQDLVEEIVRIHGYEHIPTTYPDTPTAGTLTFIQKQRRLVRQFLSSIGLDESCTYSLTTEEKATLFDIHQQKPIRLFNPMSEERAYLRHSLLPAMIDSLVYNQARKIDQVKFFEIGKNYQLGNEHELLCGVLTGDYQDSLWQGDKTPVDFFVVKGILEGLFAKLQVKEPEYVKPIVPIRFLHPGISAEIKIGSRTIGFIGKLHPQTEVQLGVKDVFVFELDFQELIDTIDPVVVMTPVPKYPSVSRDLAIIVDQNIVAKEVVDVIRSASKNSLQSVQIFDVYQGKGIEAGKKSIALNLVFQDAQKTFSAEEIDKFIDKIVSSLNYRLKAELRS